MKALQYGLTAILLSTSLSVFANTFKDSWIEHQQKTVSEEIEAGKKAKPPVEARPAAIVKNEVRPPVGAAKHELISSQKEGAIKSIKDAAAAKPDVEGRPAATTIQK